MLCFNVALLYFFVLFKPASVAAIECTNTDFNGIQTGKNFTVTWADNSGPVTLLLRMGNSTDVNKLTAMAIWVDLPGNSFVWTPASILPSGPYRFELADTAVQPVYSPQFQLTWVYIPTTSSTTPTPTPTPSSSSTSLPPIITTSTSIIPSPTSPTNSTLQTSPSPSSTSTPRLKTATKIGVGAFLLFLILIAIILSISFWRRSKRRKAALQSSSTQTSPTTDGVVHKPEDLESGSRPIEMSGALDSAISISNANSNMHSPIENGTNTNSVTISSRRPSTRPPTSEASLNSNFHTLDSSDGIAELEGEGLELQERVEIGSSGYGKQPSRAEREVAVEMEAQQRVKFEERKRRRRGVRLLVGGRKILL